MAGEARADEQFHVVVAGDEVRRQAAARAHVAKNGRQHARHQRQLRRILLAAVDDRTGIQGQTAGLGHRLDDGIEIAARQAAHHLQIALAQSDCGGRFR